MKAHEFIRETFDLYNRTSISELPDLPIQLIVEMLNNYKEGKVKKLLIASVSGSALNAAKQIPQVPQTQMALNDQLKILRIAANKLGLYDAADFIKRD